MPSLRNTVLVALATALTVLAIPTTTAQAQHHARRRPRHARVVQNRRHKPAPSRSRTARSPISAATRYASPRSAAALAGDLGAFLGRTRGGTWGVMVTSVSRGDTLYALNPGSEMRPASTMKLFTSALALHRLGPYYELTTTVLRDGPVDANGTLHGNLILRGDGDPALSGRFMDGGPNAPMQAIAQAVARAGIHRVTGKILGDATGFDTTRVPSGWLTRYLGASYAARVSALSLNENVVWVAVSPGSGGRASVALEPMTTVIPVINRARTVGGSGASLHIGKRADGTITVTGSIGRGSPTRRYSYVVDDPALFATGALQAALRANGIPVDGGVALAATPRGAVPVVRFNSPTLARMIAAMNRESINHYAELLFRDATRGRDHAVQGSAANGDHAMRVFLARVGADTSTVYNADGSGLSVDDRITARAMTQLLQYAHRAPWGPNFHASLPLAGESELLRKRMKGSPAQGNLHAKTGTTNDVIGLAGYVTAADGELIAFVFLYNGADRWTAKSTIDVMGETLASFSR